MEFRVFACLLVLLATAYHVEASTSRRRALSSRGRDSSSCPTAIRAIIGVLSRIFCHPSLHEQMFKWASENRNDQQIFPAGTLHWFEKWQVGRIKEIYLNPDKLRPASIGRLVSTERSGARRAAKRGRQQLSRRLNAQCSRPSDLSGPEKPSLQRYEQSPMRHACLHPAHFVKNLRRFFSGMRELLGLIPADRLDLIEQHVPGSAVHSLLFDQAAQLNLTVRCIDIAPLQPVNRQHIAMTGQLHPHPSATAICKQEGKSALFFVGLDSIILNVLVEEGETYDIGKQQAWCNILTVNPEHDVTACNRRERQISNDSFTRIASKMEVKSRSSFDNPRGDASQRASQLLASHPPILPSIIFLGLLLQTTPAPDDFTTVFASTSLQSREYRNESNRKASVIYGAAEREPRQAGDLCLLLLLAAVDENPEQVVSIECARDGYMLYSTPGPGQFYGAGQLIATLIYPSA